MKHRKTNPRDFVAKIAAESKKTVRLVKKLKNLGASVEEISKATGLDVEDVRILMP